MKKYSRTFGVLTYCVFLLVLQELVARAIFPEPDVWNFNRTTYSDQALSKKLNSGVLQNASFRWISNPDKFDFVHHLNLYGFRDRNWEVNTSKKRIAIIGDSFTEGFGTDDATSIPKVLESALRRNGEDVEVMNLGVGGTGLDKSLAILRDSTNIFHPNEAIIIVYGPRLYNMKPLPNDFFQTPLMPQKAHSWGPRLLKVAYRAWNGAPVPRAWHTPPFTFIAPVPDPSNPWTHSDDSLSRSVDPDIAESMKSGAFNPFVVNGLCSVMRGAINPSPNIDAILQMLQTYTREIGINVRIVYIPYSATTSDYYLPSLQRIARGCIGESLLQDKYPTSRTAFIESAQKLGFRVLDTTPYLIKQEAAGHHMYWQYDEHMRAHGYSTVAELVAQWRAGKLENNTR